MSFFLLNWSVEITVARKLGPDVDVRVYQEDQIDNENDTSYDASYRVG